MDAVTDECYRVEDLGEVIAAIRQGKRPGHLDACPRCRALLASYHAFLNPPDLPESGELEEVARRVALPGAAAVAGATPTREEARPGIVHWVMRLLELPGFRPAVAVGLVGLAVIVYLGGRPDGTSPTPSRVLRGDGPGSGAAVTLLPPREASDGGTILAWRAVPGADAYTLVLYRADLTTLDRRETPGDTTLVVPRAEMETLLAAGPLYWQVVAKKSNAELMRSTPRELVRPEGAGR